jgi:hypothetical protein
MWAIVRPPAQGGGRSLFGVERVRNALARASLPMAAVTAAKAYNEITYTDLG